MANYGKYEHKDLEAFHNVYHAIVPFCEGVSEMNVFWGSYFCTTARDLKEILFGVLLESSRFKLNELVGDEQRDEGGATGVDGYVERYHQIE